MTLIEGNDPRIQGLLKAWHERSRPVFQRLYPDLDYDRNDAKSIAVKRKFICLDRGGSGVAILDRTTGEIFLVEAYGRPNRRHRLGVLGEVTGEQLHRSTYLGGHGD